MPISRRTSQVALEVVRPLEDRRRENELSGEFEIPAAPSLMPPSLALVSRPTRNHPPLRLVEGPTSYRSMEMAAVRVEAPSSDRMLDVTFADDEAPLTLDLAALPRRGGIQTMAGAVPLVLGPPPVARVSGQHTLGKDAKPGIVAFAGYGIAPEGWTGTVGYTMRVMVRREALRDDLKIARLRRLPQRDLDLYEAAIRCADESALTKGIAIVAMSIAGTLAVIAGLAAFFL